MNSPDSDQSGEGTSPKLAEVAPSDAEAGSQDEDCYFDGPYMVFTAAFHLKRGYCCESGCRHCPYKGEKQS